MSSKSVDCSAIEERIYNHNLYISTTQDQMKKLDPNEQDVQEKREALTRKINALQEQLSSLQKTLDDCRAGKEVNFPDFDIVSADDMG
jgi:predicted  nucleic acid-binding Zn-ribbon protein